MQIFIRRNGKETINVSFLPGDVAVPSVGFETREKSVDFGLNAGPSVNALREHSVRLDEFDAALDQNGNVIGRQLSLFQVVARVKGHRSAEVEPFIRFGSEIALDVGSVVGPVENYWRASLQGGRTSTSVRHFHLGNGPHFS